MFQTRSQRRRKHRSHRVHAKQYLRARSVSLEALESRLALTGTWTALANLAPSTGPGTMELLSDGSVMGSIGDGYSWYKLAPDATGSYVNGTYSVLARMNVRPTGENTNYHGTNVLPDGRVFMLGGVANDGTLSNNGQIYDPVANTWTNIASFPESTFGNGRTMVLPDGRVLAGSITGPQTYIYNPATNTWSAGPTKLYGDPSYREVWTKLADGSILSYDIAGNPGEAQRLDVSTMTWIDSGSVPVSLQSGTDNLGPAVLLPDGRVFQLGANSNTALYTPSATPGGTGTWAAGPVLPDGLIGGQSFDSSGNYGSNYGSMSAAMMPNGHVLFVGGHSVKGDPWHILEFDPNAPIEMSLTDVTPTINGTGSLGFALRMLMLPSGQVLTATGGTTPAQLYVYSPDGAPQAAWKPTITSVVANGNHYTLTGTQLNGLSAGAAYGVGNEMDSNYPIVELKDGTGKVYFARTSNWSSTGVATGSTVVSTDFTTPVYMPSGNYSLTVIANGIPSDPVPFTGGFQGTSADLAITYTIFGNISEGDTITYNLRVTNKGPTDSTGVVLTDTLNANLKYISATKSQGTFTQTGSVVKFTVGSIAVGQSATATITVQVLEDGILTSNASVVGSVFDADLSNNSLAITTAVNELPIYVSGPISVKGKSVSNQLVATFTHANGAQPASAFAATINWGDGSTSAGTVTLSGTTYSVKGSHSFASGGTHIVTTTVVESSGGSGSMSALAVLGGTTSGTSTSEIAPTVQSQTTSPGITSRALKTASIDEAFGTTTFIRSRRALRAAANDAVLDDLLALD